MRRRIIDTSVILRSIPRFTISKSIIREDEMFHQFDPYLSDAPATDALPDGAFDSDEFDMPVDNGRVSMARTGHRQSRRTRDKARTIERRSQRALKAALRSA